MEKKIDDQLEALKRGKQPKVKTPPVKLAPEKPIQILPVKIVRPYDNWPYMKLLKLAQKQRIFIVMNRPRAGLIAALHALGAIGLLK